QIEQDLLHQSLDQTLGLIKWPAIPSGKNKYKLKDQAARESTTTIKGGAAPPSTNPSAAHTLTSPGSTTAITSPREMTPVHAKPEPPNLFYQMLLPISMDDTIPRKFGQALKKLEGLIAYGLQKTFQAVEKSLVALFTYVGDCVCGGGGGIILRSRRDLAMYRAAFRVCRHPAIDDNFDLLHAVANIYALPRESLVGYVSEGLQQALGKTTLHALIRRRWDYNVNGDKIPI
ncbi:hypothetical protein DYB32_006724, partial [Aphanomyces invadans]